MTGKSRGHSAKGHSDRDRAIASEAARWSESIRGGDDAQRQELAAWLAQSPTHVREFLLSDFIDNAVARFDPERQIPITHHEPAPNVVPLVTRGPSQDEVVPSRASARWRKVSVALVAMTAMLTFALLYFAPLARTQVYETAVGEQLTVSLADGSLVALNARTRLEVSLEPHRRNLHLIAGQAMFTVAHDSKRPFLVHVDGTTVRAVGTKFDVRRAQDRAVVAVMEGRVQIEQTPPPSMPSAPAAQPATQLTPGEGITIFPSGKVTAPTKVNLAAVQAWQDRRLIFEERTLADIAGEFAAYNHTPQLVVEGAELAARLYTGSFDANRPDTFVDYLARDPSIEVTRMDDRVIIRPAAGH